ncbi:3533_t:CDS:2 [Entrophospora sp. SA101]|nr:3533_t:CDS:2 [Entrophospora sp. SA101]
MDHQFDLYSVEKKGMNTKIQLTLRQIPTKYYLKKSEPLKEISNHPYIRKTLSSKISEKINNDVLKKPFKLPTKKKSGSDELFIEENLNDDDSMPNIIIKGDNKCQYKL